MKVLRASVAGLVLFGAVGMVLGQPRDLSVAALEKFEVRVKKQVDEALAKEFKAKEAALAKLSEPYAVGDEVTVTIEQGPRRRPVSGKFGGISGQYAQIGDNRYLLRDIDPIDRDRLYFGGNAELLKLKIDQLRHALADDRSKRAEVLRAELFRKAGYTATFFANSVRLGDRFWLLDDLGNQTIRMVMTLSPHNGYADLTLQNRSGNPTAAVVLLGDRPVATTLETVPDRPAFSEKVWNREPFRLLASDLGDRPGETVANKLRLWLMKDRVGSWMLKPYVAGRPTSVRRSVIDCPECLGTRVVPAAADDATGATRPCPTCNGEGTIQVEPYDVKRIEFTFAVVKSRIDEFDARQRGRFLKMAGQSGAYLTDVAEMLAQRQVKARTEREAREQEAQRLAEERQRQEAERRQAEEQRKQVEAAYEWLTPEQARELGGEEIDPKKKFYTSDDFDDMFFPTKLFFGLADDPHREEVALEKYTDWVRVKRVRPPREANHPFELYVLRYRILKTADTEEKLGKFYLQYWQRYANSTPKVLRFSPAVKVEFNDGSEMAWEDTFTTPSTWGIVGLFGMKEVSLDHLRAGIKTVSLTGKLAGEKSGD